MPINTIVPSEPRCDVCGHTTLYARRTRNVQAFVAGSDSPTEAILRIRRCAGCRSPLVTVELPVDALAEHVVIKNPLLLEASFVV